MACLHPPEERQPVYDGTANARVDRQFCGLCGEHIYLAPVIAQGASLAAMTRVQASTSAAGQRAG